MLKKCTKCEQIQSADCFYKSSQTKDGLRRDCKKCGLCYQQQNRKLTRQSTNKWAAKNSELLKFKNKKLREVNKKNNENTEVIINELQCSCCLKIKNIKAFSKNSTNKTGYNFWCKVCLKKSNQDYNKRNPYKRRIITANYRARKIQRTPVWADLVEIAKIYQNCPVGYHVDHIVPLNGENVSGLHVSWNLQYLTAEENVRKKNSFGS